jgi:hypothetical protein
VVDDVVILFIALTVVLIVGIVVGGRSMTKDMAARNTLGE